jgi:hypothetical protein
MSTKVFHLTLEGPDSDFGPISNYPVKITIESKLTWEKGECEEFKECLSEYFEVRPQNIRTDEEEKQDAADLDKYLQEQIAKL